LNTEFVGEISVVIAPKLLFEGNGYSPTRGHRIEQLFGDAEIVMLDENGASLHRL
jgi:hypothetical protein